MINFCSFEAHFWLLNKILFLLLFVLWIKSEFLFAGENFGHYIIFHSNHLFWLLCVLCFYLSGKVALQVWFSEINLSLVDSEQIWYFKPTFSRYGSFQAKSFDDFRTIWVLKRSVEHAFLQSWDGFVIAPKIPVKTSLR